MAPAGGGPRTRHGTGPRCHHGLVLPPTDAPVVLAQLPQPVVVLVWVLALVSTGVFIWRRLQGIGLSGQPKRPKQPDPLESSLPLGDDLAAPAPPPRPPAPATRSPSVPEQHDPLEPRPAPSEPSTPAVVEGSSRTGFFAPVPTTPDGPGDAAPDATRVTVAEALHGIVMPCGLTPVIDGSSRVQNPFRALFLTSDADARAVGAGIGDELERLGYSLTTSAPTELTARRDRTTLRVVLHPEPAKATRGLDVLFPAAPPSSVGVELST